MAAAECGEAVAVAATEVADATAEDNALPLAEAVTVVGWITELIWLAAVEGAAVIFEMTEVTVQVQ
jgi:hypothetical protein